MGKSLVGGCLLHIGDYITQSCGDYNKSWNKDPYESTSIMEVGVFFLVAQLNWASLDYLQGFVWGDEDTYHDWIQVLSYFGAVFFGYIKKLYEKDGLNTRDKNPLHKLKTSGWFVDPQNDLDNPPHPASPKTQEADSQSLMDWCQGWTCLKHLWCLYQPPILKHSGECCTLVKLDRFPNSYCCGLTMLPCLTLSPCQTS